MERKSVMTSEEYLSDLWIRVCGKWSRSELNDFPTILYRSEWSEEFEEAMRKRMVIGAYRYGKLNDPNKPRYDRTEAIRKRLALYEATGNLEALVDIANLCLCEFVEGDHPKRHFRSGADFGHVETK